MLKKIVKIVVGVALATLVILAAGVQYLLSQPEPEGFPILEYHMVQEKNPDKAEELANQHMINAYENMVDKGLLEMYD